MLISSQRIDYYLVLIICISLITRFWLLGSIPANIQPDAADTIRFYLISQLHPDAREVQFNWNGAPAVNMLLIGYGWELFNRSIVGLRFATALFSAIAVVLFYLFTRKIGVEKLFAFLISISLAVHPWYLNFSRSGWENIFNAVNTVLAMIGLYEFIHQKNYKLSLPFLILASTLAFYFYHPGKLYFPAIFFILFIHTVNKWNKTVLQYLVLYTVLTLSIILPLFLKTIRSRDVATNRIQAVSVIGKPVLLKENVKNNIPGFLFYHPDYFQGYLNNRYLPNSERIFNVGYVALYLLGIILSLRRHWYIPLLFVLLLLPIQLLSIHTPDAARSVHIVPIIFLFILIGLNGIYQVICRRITNKQIILFVFSSFIFFVTIHDGMRYAIWIDDAQTLSAREPAVWKSEYGIWLDYQIKSVQENGRGVTVGEWKEIKKTLPITE